MIKPADIRKLRRQLGEDTATFGARFISSGRSVESWEQGRRVPHLAIQRLMAATQARLKRHRKAKRLKRASAAPIQTIDAGSSSVEGSE
jgi:hypothetical protein